MSREPLSLRVPATSANLGPGFDALGLAMELFLEVEASAAGDYLIEASGRNRELVGSLKSNLLLDTYRSVFPGAPPLRLRIHNEIPLGMGCGSSAAALVAGVMLADHFGDLGMTPERILEEACRREGHPDNVAACLYGGLTASCMDEKKVTAASFFPRADPSWQLLLALPGVSLATSEARGLLPQEYSREDAVANVQATALLISAFALNRPELLLPGTRDRMHQPYRIAACPLLGRLLPLAGTPGIHSVTLSGAGPSVLLIVDSSAALPELRERILLQSAGEAAELLETRILDPLTAPASFVGPEALVTRGLPKSRK